MVAAEPRGPVEDAQSSTRSVVLDRSLATRALGRDLPGWGFGPVTRYSVLGALHRGGMGELFLGRLEGPEGFARKVVLKGVLPSRPDDADADAEALLLREARLMAMLDHPNIVRVFDLTAIEGRPYLVMEYLRGRNFHQVIQRGVTLREGLPPRVALHVVAEALRGLHHAHVLQDDQGRPLEIVHRDVTPGNVLVSFFGEVKITDFGIAKHRDSPRLTAPRSIRGKARYIAPEQIYGEPASVQSDVYSAGVALAEAILGAPLWDRPSIAETLLSIVSEDRARTVARILDGRTEIPGLESVLRCALAAAPRARFDSARAFTDALGDVQRSIGGPHSASELSRFLTTLYQDSPDLTAREAIEARANDGRASLEESPYADDDPTLIAIDLRILAEGVARSLHVRAQEIPVASAVMVDAPMTDPNRSSLARDDELPTLGASPAQALSPQIQWPVWAPAPPPMRGTALPAAGVRYGDEGHLGSSPWVHAGSQAGSQAGALVDLRGFARAAIAALPRASEAEQDEAMRDAAPTRPVRAFTAAADGGVRKERPAVGPRGVGTRVTRGRLVGASARAEPSIATRPTFRREVFGDGSFDAQASRGRASASAGPPAPWTRRAGRPSDTNSASAGISFGIQQMPGLLVGIVVGAALTAAACLLALALG